MLIGHGTRINWAALVSAGAFVVACEAGIRLVEPRESSAPPTVLSMLAADTGLARRAGWTTGVPGASVLIRRDQDLSVLSFASDQDGMLSLGDLPAADYWIWAEKRPSGAELEFPLLAPPVLGGGLHVSLNRGSQQALALRGQENGSLVISEFHYHDPPSSFGQVYFWFHWYIELYNNSDTTIYLDGKIVGAGFNYYLDGEQWPCSETAPFRNDARGVWSQRFQAFPGSGHDHPLAPGQTVVIAEQAIDHSLAFPGLPDLSHAEFQFHWPDRGLNPAVPTMLPIQISTGIYQTLFYLAPEVAFVAMPVDIASLEHRRARYQGDFGLFPRDTILDLAVLYSTYDLGPQTVAPYCRTIVDSSLDLLAAFVRPSQSYQDDSTHLLSAQRKLLPDGRHLRRTGTSAVDWTIGRRSPGKVP